MNKLFGPFREIEKEIADQVSRKAPEYEAAFLAWDLRKKSLENQIRQEVRKGQVSQEVQNLLAKHLSSRPGSQEVPKFVYEDPTPEAVVNGLCQTWNSAAVVSSEAANFLNGRASADLSLWNRIWDGAGIGVERIGRGAMFSHVARGSLILAVQEKPFEDFRNVRGDEAMEIGFLARLLISNPPNMIGNRIIDETDKVVTWESLDGFQERIRKILRNEICNSHTRNLDRKRLSFSDRAKRKWIDLFNEVEKNIQPGGSLAYIPGYASKICENVARVAAVFHYFEGKEGSLIQEEDIANAEKVVRWHTDQFLRAFVKEGQVPVEKRDANALEVWLLEHVWRGQKEYVQKNFIRQFGPNSLRNKMRLDNAIQLLISANIVQIRLDSCKTRLVYLNPHHFGKPRWYGNGI